MYICLFVPQVRKLSSLTVKDAVLATRSCLLGLEADEPILWTNHSFKKHMQVVGGVSGGGVVHPSGHCVSVPVSAFCAAIVCVRACVRCL